MRSTDPTRPIKQGAPVFCSQCNLNRICLPAALELDQMPLLEGIITSDRVLEKDQYLFHQQQPFHKCFAVRSGAIKTFIIDENGAERITDFYLPGDIVGLDSINIETYPCSAMALERSNLCDIPFEALNGLMQQVPALKHYFFELMGRKIRENHQVSMILSHYTADQRLVFLLLSLSERFRHRNQSPTRYRIPISRGDMAGYLGLSKETVSRALHRLCDDDLIALDGRYAVLHDPERLRGLLTQSGALRRPS